MRKKKENIILNEKEMNRSWLMNEKFKYNEKVMGIRNEMEIKIEMNRQQNQEQEATCVRVRQKAVGERRHPIHLPTFGTSGLFSGIRRTPKMMVDRLATVPAVIEFLNSGVRRNAKLIRDKPYK